jgi:acyl CoA:acetate/3-ketoacid CoA transferase beta subunit
LDVSPDGLVLKEIAPGMTAEEVIRATGADVRVDPGLKQIEV